MELTELLDVDPTRIDLVEHPSVPKARKWLLFKSKERKEESMATTFVEDLTGVTEKIKTALSGKDEVKKEAETLLADIKAAVEDESVEFAEEDVAEALKALDAAMETETVTKEDVTAYHAQVKDLLAKASIKKEEEEEEEDPTKTALKKADLTDEQRAEIENILKAEAERVQQIEKQREARITKAEAEATAAREEIQKMQIKSEHHKIGRAHV